MADATPLLPLRSNQRNSGGQALLTMSSILSVISPASANSVKGEPENARSLCFAVLTWTRPRNSVFFFFFAEQIEQRKPRHMDLAMTSLVSRVCRLA